MPHTIQAFQHIADPRPQAAHAAWRCTVSGAARMRPWGRRAGFACERIVAASWASPPTGASDEALLEHLLGPLEQDFAGELAFVPAPLAPAFARFLDAFAPAFLEGRDRFDWDGQEEPMDAWNPRADRGHVLGWRHTARGTWAVSAEAGEGAAPLLHALDVFGRRHRLEGAVVGAEWQPPLFDPTRTWLMFGPDLPQLVGAAAAAHNPVLAHWLETGYADGFLGWNSLLGPGPNGTLSPFAGCRVALAPDSAVDPRLFDEWADLWQARSVVPDCRPDWVLDAEGTRPVDLFRRLVRQPSLA